MRRAAYAWELVFGVGALAALVAAVVHLVIGEPLTGLGWAAVAKVSDEMGGVIR